MSNPVKSSRADVTLSEGYWIGKYEVTQDEYELVMAGNPNEVQGARLPVDRVTWDEAMTFCKKLTESERMAGRLPESWEFSLPTEAQREYACRAGTTTMFSFGDDWKRLGEYAWYSVNAEGTIREVGRKKANNWGLHDVHGNVREWCLDPYTGELPEGADPDVEYRVFRGGGCEDFFLACASGVRFAVDPRKRIDTVGFRLALVRAADTRD